MGNRILLLRYEAPLQSWGIRSRWDVRDSSTEPTKSGTIGLLGCALGYPMRDPRLQQLDSVFRFGVRVENPGRAVVDYHTITDFLPTADGRFKHSGSSMAISVEKLRVDPDALPTTIQSHRTYIEDGAFLIALETSDENRSIVDDCALALQKPQWPLFLGRKACIPTRPIFHAVTDQYVDIEDAFRRILWEWLGPCRQPRRLKDRPATLKAFVEIPMSERGPQISTRQDATQINDARLYGFRTVKSLTVDLPRDLADASIIPQAHKEC